MNRLLLYLVVTILTGTWMTASAQSPTGTVTLTATVAQTPLALSQGSFDVSPLVAGQCYRIPADIQNPLAYGQNTNLAVSGITVSFTESIITGDVLS